MTTPIEQSVRFCPRCAVPVDKPGKIPFRCAECDYTMFFGPVAAVGGLVTDDSDHVLLVRRARDPGRGKWGLPGGFVDRDETVEAALSREVYEETRLRVSTMNLIVTFPNQYNYRGVLSPVIDLFYECPIPGRPEIRLEVSELDEYRWVRRDIETLQPYLDEMAFPSNRRAILAWVA